MELSPEVTALLTSPTVLGIAGATLLGLVLSTGLSMKFAIGWTTSDSPSLFRAFTIIAVMAFVGFAFSVLTGLFVPPAYGWIAAAVMLLVYLKVFGMLARCSMPRALFTAVLYRVFALVGGLVVLGASGGAFYYTVAEQHPDEMQELTALAQQVADAAAAQSQALVQEQESDSEQPAFDIRNVFFTDDKSEKDSQQTSSVPVDGSWLTDSPWLAGSGNRSEQPADEPTQTGSSSRLSSNPGRLQVQTVLDRSKQQDNPFAQ